MSAYTTLTVSRAMAIAKIVEIRNKRLPTNQELEEELEECLGEHNFYNFTVVDDLSGTDDEILMRLKKETA